MTNEPKEVCTVLVCSCDKYADILPPFAALWQKFWPDCPFETVLVTETDPHITGFNRVVACGRGGTWCSRLVQALDAIDTPYVLMLCDDYFLADKVNMPRLLSRLSQMQEFSAANLRLIPNPKPTAANAKAFGHNMDLFQYKPLMAYSVATQTGFWKREFLRSLADGRASIWEFERYGSFDNRTASEILLVTKTKEFPFVDAVHKGHWERFGLNVCRANNIDLNGIKRTLPPFKTRLVEGFKGLVFRIVPWNWLVRIQNALGVGAKEKHDA